MSTMKQHRAIGIVDEEGQTMTVMAVHESIGEQVVKQLLRRYTYEIVLRVAQAKIAGKEDGIHIVHRMNLLKKCVRLTPGMAGYVMNPVVVVDAPLFDTKDWKKKYQSVLVREYRRAYGTGDDNVIRPVETEEERAFYEMHDVDAINSLLIPAEKVYFIDVKKGSGSGSDSESGIVKLNLYTYMEERL